MPSSLQSKVRYFGASLSLETATRLLLPAVVTGCCYHGGGRLGRWIIVLAVTTGCAAIQMPLPSPTKLTCRKAAPAAV